MARIDWVRDRLEEWARWSAQSDGGGLGYPSQCAFVRLGGSGGQRESVIPTNSINAAETDRAVSSLQLSQSHLYLVLKLHYAKGLPRDRVARQMCRAESTIKRNLEDADHALARWFDDKQQAQRLAAERK